MGASPVPFVLFDTPKKARAVVVGVIGEEQTPYKYSLEHVPVPPREPVPCWRLLVQGVAPEDEVVTPLRRAAPDVGGLEAATAEPVQVRHENLVVHRRPVFSRPEVLHCNQWQEQQKRQRQIDVDGRTDARTRQDG